MQLTFRLALGGSPCPAAPWAVHLLHMWHHGAWQFTASCFPPHFSQRPGNTGFRQLLGLWSPSQKIQTWALCLLTDDPPLPCRGLLGPPFPAALGVVGSEVGAAADATGFWKVLAKNCTVSLLYVSGTVARATVTGGWGATVGVWNAAALGVGSSCA